MATTYDPIATTTLGSAAASITFSSIAASWTDLKLVVVATTAGQDSVQIRFNGDAAANYSHHDLYSNQVSVGAVAIAATDAIILALSAVASPIPVSFLVDIFSYAGSTYKTILSSGSGDKNGGVVAQGVEITTGMWRNTAAITSIALTLNGGGNFSTGTTATLYGILKA